jgi:Tol biopolymer transport system component
LGVADESGREETIPYLDSKFTEGNATLSPGGEWIAYSSDASKRNETYVERFPTHADRRQVSVTGGSVPRWSRDGKELYFVALDRKLMAAEIDGGPKRVRGTPKSLFETHLPANGRYDVTKDGRFLIPTQIESSGTSMNVIVNWTANPKK